MRSLGAPTRRSRPGRPGRTRGDRLTRNRANSSTTNTRNTARGARTSRPGSTCSTWMTTSPSAARPEWIGMATVAPPDMNDQRLDVRKTYKLYVGGQFVRSESGRAPHAKIATAAKGKQHRIPVDPYSPATLPMNRLLQGVPPSGGRTSGRLKPGLRASSRRSEPHSFSGKGSQSLLTSAATVQGFRREDLLGRILWMKSVSHSIGLPWRPLRPLREAPQPDSG